MVLAALQCGDAQNLFGAEIGRSRGARFPEIGGPTEYGGRSVGGARGIPVEVQVGFDFFRDANDLVEVRQRANIAGKIGLMVLRCQLRQSQRDRVVKDGITSAGKPCGRVGESFNPIVTENLRYE